MRRRLGDAAWGVAATATLAVSLAGCAAAPRLVDADPASGFAVYRSGRLTADELDALCRAGVEEMLVLDGSASRRECRLRAERCPGLRVVYDRRQSADEPVSAGFLERFDAWVQEARAAGRKIAFRCRHGWHRTGRLAAWYQMRFQGSSPEEARAGMHEAGRFMARHPSLDDQVEAMHDLLSGEPCSVAASACVRDATSPSEPPFTADVCGD